MGRLLTLGKNTGLVFIGNIGSKMISFLMLPFYTRYLSVNEYGVSDLLIVYSSLLLPIVSLALYEAIFVIPNGKNHKEISSYFTSSLFFTFVSFLICGIICFLIYGILPNNSFFKEYLWIIFILVVISSLQSLLQQFCIGIKKVLVFSISGIVLTALTALLGFALVPLYGLTGFIQSMIWANILTILFTFIFARCDKYINIKFINNKSTLEMLLYSLPLIPNTIMWWVMNSVNRLVLEKYTSLYIIGLLAVAMKFPNIVNSVISPLTSAWRISVLQEFGKDGYSEFYNKILLVITSVTAIGIALFILLSEYIVRLFTTEEYYAAIKFVPYLSINIYFLIISSVVGATFSATKQSRYYLYSSLGGAGCSLLLNFWFIPIWGIWGAIFALLSSQGITALLRVIFANRIVSITKLSFYVVMLLFLLLIAYTYIQLKFLSVAVFFIMSIYVFMYIKKIIFNLIKR